jgi:hypothetical protein
MIRSRSRFLIVALCASLLPASASAAGTTRDSARPAVACSGGVCVTHFQAQISGTQSTSWKLPYQRAGAADCYHVPYVSGEGNQKIRFAGSGLVEARRVGHNAPTFSYLYRGRTRSGIGEGHAGIDRGGHRVRHVENGPCGPSHDPDYDSFSECGSQARHWTYQLESPQRNRVALSGDEALGSLASGATFAFCPLMSTGISGVGDLGYLYDGFSEQLPARDLFNPEFGKLILLGRRDFADPSPSYLGITGKTRIRWTVSLTRVAHRRFPIAR